MWEVALRIKENLRKTISPMALVFSQVEDDYWCLVGRKYEKLSRNGKRLTCEKPVLKTNETEWGIRGKVYKCRRR